MVSSHHIWFSGALEQHVIIVSTDRTAVGLWLQKRLEVLVDSEAGSLHTVFHTILSKDHLQGGGGVFVI